LITPAHFHLWDILAQKRILQNILFMQVITFSFLRKIIPKRWTARTPFSFIQVLINGGKNLANEDLETQWCRISLYLDREGDPHVRTRPRLRYYVFASKLKVLRYVVRAKDAGARVEMWVILHAYAHSCTPRVLGIRMPQWPGYPISACPRLVTRTERSCSQNQGKFIRTNTHSWLVQFCSFFSPSSHLTQLFLLIPHSSLFITFLESLVKLR
jgi:hypothetical protein